MNGFYKNDWQTHFYDDSRDSVIFRYERSWGDSDFTLEFDLARSASIRSRLSFRVPTEIDLVADTIEGESMIKYSSFNDEVLIKMTLHQRTKKHNIYSESIFNEILFKTDQILTFANQVRGVTATILEDIERKLAAGLDFHPIVKKLKFNFKLQPSQAFLDRLSNVGNQPTYPFQESWYTLEQDIIDRIKRNLWIPDAE